MNKLQSELARKNLDRKLQGLGENTPVRPRSGWIRAIRDAIGMTTRQLAARMGVSQSRIVALEQAEATDSTTLKSLRDAAEAMDCQLVYAIVPRTSLEQMVRDRAHAKATAQFGHVSQGMLLENQSLTAEQMREEIDRLADEIAREPARLLWDDA